MKTILTESTLIPISALSLLFAIAAWLTTIYRQGEANASQITEIKQKQVNDIDKIDGKLDKINDKIDKLLENNKVR